MAQAGSGSATTSSVNPVEDADNPPLSLRQSVISAAQGITHSVQSGGSWRYITHVLLIVTIVSVAAAGKIQADSLSGIKKSNLGSTDQDQSVVLASGAILAEQTQLVMASDVKQRADTMANQTTLATSSDSFLKSKAPIATGDPAKRGVISHTVAAGETASTIAGQFGITTDTVVWANSLSDEAALKPGQQLMILPINGLMITASGGESVESLASTYKASANLIDSYNQLEGKPLAAGQKLIIPDGVKPTPQQAPAPTRLASVTAKSPTTIMTGGGSKSNGYSYGYCTYYVATRRAIPSTWGNASSWSYNAAVSGYGVGTIPRAGAVAWENGNHVAYVERVNGDGTVTVSEMNFWSNGGGWNRVSTRTTSASHFKYIY